MASVAELARESSDGLGRFGSVNRAENSEQRSEKPHSNAPFRSDLLVAKLARSKPNLCKTVT